VCAFANTATTCPPMMMFIITSKTFNFYDSMMCARAKVCVRRALLLMKSDQKLWVCRFLPSLWTAKK